MGKTVTTYLLGAGFSRSACDSLPLSFDFFDRVRAKTVGDMPFLRLNPSFQALDEFVSSYFPTAPDLEDVMSFLFQQYFPQGFRQHWQHRTDLYTELLHLVAATFGETISIPPAKANTLTRFADRLVRDGSNVLVFNYDCILDSFLRETGDWNCASGYGIVLRHISDCFHETLVPSGKASSMSLLKLHGSVNWGVPEMHVPEHSDAEVFFTSPDLDGFGSNITSAGVNIPLSKGFFHGGGFRPFIIPPIVDKSQFYNSRILRRLWYFAREVLSVSDQVVILGYSFPPTDYMARFLLREAFGMHLAQYERRKVIVVNKSCDTEYRRRVEPLMVRGDIEFIEDDALSFIERLCDEPSDQQDKAVFHVHCPMYPSRMPYLTGAADDEAADEDDLGS